MDSLHLRIHNLIAAREFNTAKANQELYSGGGWLCDHAEIDHQLDAEIELLLASLEREEKEKP